MEVSLKLKLNVTRKAEMRKLYLQDIKEHTLHDPKSTALESGVCSEYLSSHLVYLQSL